MDIQRTIRYALSLSIVLVFLLHVGGKLSLRLLDTLENHACDARVKLNTPHGAGKQVVIVDSNEKSLQATGRRPWRRDVMASITDKLFDHYRARVVGFEVLFAEADLDESELLLQRWPMGRRNMTTPFRPNMPGIADDLQRDRQFGQPGQAYNHPE